MKQELSNALTKAQRAVETGVDPISGYTLQDCLDWLEEHEPFDPIESVEWRIAVDAFKRRNSIPV